MGRGARATRLVETKEGRQAPERAATHQAHRAGRGAGMRHAAARAPGKSGAHRDGTTGVRWLKGAARPAGTAGCRRGLQAGGLRAWQNVGYYSGGVKSGVLPKKGSRALPKNLVNWHAWPAEKRPERLGRGQRGWGKTTPCSQGGREKGQGRVPQPVVCRCSFVTFSSRGGVPKNGGARARAKTAVAPARGAHALRASELSTLPAWS